MFLLFSKPFEFVTGELEQIPLWTFNLLTTFRQNLKTLCVYVQNIITMNKSNNPKNSMPIAFYIFFVVKLVG